MKSKSNNINTMIIVGAWYRNSLAVALSYKKKQETESIRTKRQTRENKFSQRSTYVIAQGEGGRLNIQMDGWYSIIKERAKK